MGNQLYGQLFPCGDYDPPLTFEKTSSKDGWTATAFAKECVGVSIPAP